MCKRVKCPHCGSANIVAKPNHINGDIVYECIKCSLPFILKNEKEEQQLLKEFEETVGYKLTHRTNKHIYFEKGGVPTYRKDGSISGITLTKALHINIEKRFVEYYLYGRGYKQHTVLGLDEMQYLNKLLELWRIL